MQRLEERCVILFEALGELVEFVRKVAEMTECEMRKDGGLVIHRAQQLINKNLDEGKDDQ